MIEADNTPVAEAELREDVDAFTNPVGAAGLARVLILGDSISIGYTTGVRRQLRGTAAVWRPSENCQHSGYHLQRLDHWLALGDGTWDVIHINAGIWDTHMMDADGNLIRNVDEESRPGVRIRFSPSEYGDNVERILDRLAATNARVVWALTTPVLCRSGERLQAVPALNDVARPIMERRGIPINDLHAFVMPHAAEWQEADRVHFNDQGNHHLAIRVAHHIRHALS